MFWRRFFIVIGSLIILAFIAQLLISPYVKGLIIKNARGSLGVDVSIGNCNLSVLQRRIVLDDIKVINPENKDDYFIRAKQFSADFYLIPLLFNKQVLRTVSLTAPEVVLYLDGSGVLKMPKTKKSQGQKTAKKPGVLFGRLRVSNGNLKFIDQKVSAPATITEFSAIDGDINNSPSFLGGKVVTVVDIKGKIEEQGRFSVKGKADLLSKPISFDGDINIESVPLENFSPYYANSLSVIVKKGNLFIDTKARCDKGNLDVRNKVRIENLDIQPIGDPTQTVLFELKTSDVIDLLRDENNAVRFEFDIVGDLNKPDFRWGPAMMAALKQAVLRTFTNGVARILNNPVQASEKIGNIIGGEAGEKVKKIGEKLQKILGN